jgi:hypothetical protein
MKSDRIGMAFELRKLKLKLKPGLFGTSLVLMNGVVNSLHKAMVSRCISE